MMSMHPSNGDNVEPSGNCFVAAFKYVLKMSDCQDDSEEFVRVHGNIGTLPQDEDVNHAWVEWNQTVHEVSNGLDLRFLQDEYYARFRVKNIRRYTLDEALWENLRSSHYGPWP